jgi:hypothetical protein
MHFSKPNLVIYKNPLLISGYHAAVMKKRGEDEDPSSVVYLHPKKRSPDTNASMVSTAETSVTPGSSAEEQKLVADIEVLFDRAASKQM